MILDSMAPDEMREVALVFEEGIKAGGNLLKKIIEMKMGGSSAATVKAAMTEFAEKNPFVFHGTEHDLSYFWTRSELPLDAIKELPPELQQDVVKVFSAAQEQGLVQCDGQRITLTPEGKRYIHDLSYVSDVVKADTELNEQITQGIDERLTDERFVPAHEPSVSQEETVTATTSTRKVQMGTVKETVPHGTQKGAASVGKTTATPSASVGVAEQGTHAVTQSTQATTQSAQAAAQQAAQRSAQAAAQTAQQTAQATAQTAQTAANAGKAAGSAAAGTAAGGVYGLAAAVAQQAVSTLNNAVTKLAR